MEELERDFKEEKKEIWKNVKKELLEILPKECTLKTDRLENDDTYLVITIELRDGNYITLQCDCDNKEDYYGITFYITSDKVGKEICSYIYKDNFINFITNYNSEEFKSIYKYINIINNNINKLESVRSKLISDRIESISEVENNKKILNDLKSVIEDIENNRLYY